MLQAELWRLQTAYAEFTNDGLLLAAFTRGGLCSKPLYVEQHFAHAKLLSSRLAPHATMEAQIAGSDQEE